MTMLHVHTLGITQRGLTYNYRGTGVQGGILIVGVMEILGIQESLGTGNTRASSSHRTVVTCSSYMSSSNKGELGNH